MPPFTRPTAWYVALTCTLASLMANNLPHQIASFCLLVGGLVALIKYHRWGSG